MAGGRLLHDLGRPSLELGHLLPKAGVAPLEQVQLVLDFGVQPLQLGLLPGQHGPLPGYPHLHLPHLPLQPLLVLPELPPVVVHPLAVLGHLGRLPLQLVGPLLQLAPGLRGRRGRGQLAPGDLLLDRPELGVQLLDLAVLRRQGGLELGLGRRRPLLGLGRLLQQRPQLVQVGP